ncbi:tetratricopeptide repeat protein [Deinococcus arcticus]|uniref:Uncharacterized protein n=1 Tax=Deinococcus arcticus TaxID=2136176 RepID=A0A2T3W429_9DEIO|nr:tetratricopeptide repeat protein [Deinococcus arcticus]PTA66544.1 hypothetical protein C8263_17300 [Deinococcus arcticus]
MNAFETYLVNLTKTTPAPLFVRLSEYNFLRQNFDDPGYRFSQVFEPQVLQELAMLNPLDIDQLEQLNYGVHDHYQSVPWMLRHLQHVTNPQKINLANFLISVCRYALARRVFATIETRQLPARFLRDYHLLGFLLTNRTGQQSQSSEDHLSAILSMVKAGQLQPAEVAHIAAQAIVWNVKDGSVSTSTADTFISLAAQVMERTRDLNVKADWYRAYAMVPAYRTGDSKATTHMMDLAEAAAREAHERDPATVNSLKTVYESRVKEYLHVSRDYALAEQYGARLIQLDPVWSLSYGEMAEVFEAQGNFQAALTYLEKAVELGAPYTQYHRYNKGRMLVKLERYEEALRDMRTISQADPTCLSAVAVGLKLSNHLQDQDHRAHFQQAWTQLEMDNHLTTHHHNFMASEALA